MFFHVAGVAAARYDPETSKVEVLPFDRTFCRNAVKLYLTMRFPPMQRPIFVAGAIAFSLSFLFFAQSLTHRPTLKGVLLPLSLPLSGLEITLGIRSYRRLVRW